MDPRSLANIDGIDMWDALSNDQKSPRVEMLYNIDDIDNYAAIRKGEWKYVYGTIAKGQLDKWYGDSGLGSQYTYDEELVMKSKANIALVGAITRLQISEKKARGM